MPRNAAVYPISGPDTNFRDPYVSAAADGHRNCIVKESENYHRKLYRTHPELLPESLQQMWAFLYAKEESETQKYYLVTVNFPPDTSIESIKYAVNSWTQRKYVDLYHLSWEYHGKENNHPHIHALAYNLTNRADYIKRTATHFRELGCRKESIDVKPVTVGTVKRTAAYVHKTREKDAENPRYQKDKEWRTENRLWCIKKGTSM